MTQRNKHLSRIIPCNKRDQDKNLIDGVNLVEVIEDEIEDRCSGGRRSVELSGLVDLEAGLLGLRDLDLDVGRGLLGVLKVLDQGAVAQDVVPGR